MQKVKFLNYIGVTNLSEALQSDINAILSADNVMYQDLKVINISPNEVLIILIYKKLEKLKKLKKLKAPYDDESCSSIKYRKLEDQVYYRRLGGTERIKY